MGGFICCSSAQSQVRVGETKSEQLVLAVLTDSLAGNNRLHELDLSSNWSQTATGWDSFTCVLRNPNSASERLDLEILRGADTINDQNDLICRYVNQKQLVERIPYSSVRHPCLSVRQEHNF